MPLSNTLHLPAVLHFVQAVPHDRVLDVGVGTGTYGFMLRQYLDVAHERLDPATWRTTIDGVECFAGYRNPIWTYSYNRVIEEDVRRALPALGRYDVVLCCDVLEHFPRPEARSLISALLGKATVLVATTPNVAFEQGPWAGNEAERHHSVLGAEDFPDLVGAVACGVTTCYVSSADTEARRRLTQAVATCPILQQPQRRLGARLRARVRRIAAGDARDQGTRRR